MRDSLFRSTVRIFSIIEHYPRSAGNGRKKREKKGRGEEREGREGGVKEERIILKNTQNYSYSR